jgi:hypothetical protein
MNTYYTAKDIEELAAKGTKRIELGPRVFLTDFARETAQQLGVELVESRRQVSSPTPPTLPTQVSDRYNKPKGCQHGSGSFSAANGQTAIPIDRSRQAESLQTMNKLVDLMDEAIKRGG